MEIKLGSQWETKPQYKRASCVISAVHGGYIEYTETDGSVYESRLDEFVAIWTPVITNTAVDKPQHYQVFPDKEAIEIIASSMTTEQFYGYCLGNFLKYRLRIGAKDEVQQELGKSNKYKELYEKHKHLCE